MIDNDFSQIKIVLSDVDGVLSDGGMYLTSEGIEFKKFHVHDGMGFVILKELGFKVGIITSEDSDIINFRAKKLKLDYVFKGRRNNGKLDAVKEICKQENLSLSNVAYIGDDINCIELLNNVGVCACPFNATRYVKKIDNIIVLSKNGGDGAFREFVEMILDKMGKKEV